MHTKTSDCSLGINSQEYEWIRSMDSDQDPNFEFKL